MKRLFLLLLPLLLLSCGKSHEKQRVLVQKVIKEYLNEMEKEYHLLVVDYKSTGKHKLKKVAINFYNYDELEVLAARQLLYRSSEELLKRLNKEKNLLDGAKFTEKNLQISIAFIDPMTHKRYQYSNLDHVSLFEGRILFSIVDQMTGDFETILEENYTSPHHLTKERS